MSWGFYGRDDAPPLASPLPSEIDGMEIPEDRLHIKYEPEHDLLSVWLDDFARADAVEVEPGVCVRVSDEGAVIGLEIVDAAARLQKDAQTLESRPYAVELLRKYGRKALSDLAHAQ